MDLMDIFIYFQVLFPHLFFRREAHFCVFSKSCDEPSYEKLVRSLCKEHGIPIIEVEDKAELGQMVGQCKMDKDGKARKIVGCSVAVVKDYGRDEEAKNDLEEFLKKGGGAVTKAAAAVEE